MKLPKLTTLELQILDSLWSRGQLSIRELQEAFPKPKRPTYTTIQSSVYRLEKKGAVRRVRKIGNAHMFEALVTRQDTSGRLIDDLVSLFGGRTQPVMAHLAESGQLTLEDIRETEKLIRELHRKN